MDNNSQVKKSEKNIVNDVLVRVNQFQAAGELTIPKDYSVENALKSAYLILSETVDKDKNPVLQSCSHTSIANTLLNMVTQGLSPLKKQCYFISYAGKLQLSRSYQGSIAIARRSGLKNIVANVIYEKDDFAYKINPETGLYEILKHEQALENIDTNKIKGAYALATLEDGTKELTVMNITQIRKAWMQGYAKGNSGAHNNFTDEMCKKTVINRACKNIINSSTDAYLFDRNSDEQQNETKFVPEDANTKTIGIEEPKETIIINENVDTQFQEPEKIETAPVIDIQTDAQDIEPDF